MALANFFDKVSLGAAQRIKNYDRTGFEDQLSNVCVEIVYGTNAVVTREGQVTLELLTNLLSRLYPNIRFNDQARDEASIGATAKLKVLAKSINPGINTEDQMAPTLHIVVGAVDSFQTGKTTFFIGSDRWDAFFSTRSQQVCGKSHNPFGAAAAVCFSLANLFRLLFVGNPGIDEDFCFSTLDQKKERSVVNHPLPGTLPVNFTLVGTGAIGNAVVWVLNQLSQLTGSISLIDDQSVALSNLQRYVMTDQDSVNKSKVELLHAALSKHKQLTVYPHANKWQEVAAGLSHEALRLLVTALDSKEDRLVIQSVLPEKVLNAWTSEDNIGVSRHLDFVNESCLSCIYFPSVETKGYAQLVADSLGMGHPEHERQVRHYIGNNLPIDEGFIQLVSPFLKLPAGELRQYIGQPVPAFYSNEICGGRIVPVNGKDIEVPLAHESVLAGVLLAAEIVIESLGIRKEPIEPLTKINLVRPLSSHLLEEEAKHFSGRCICQDKVIVDRYREKWGLTV